MHVEPVEAAAQRADERRDGATFDEQARAVLVVGWGQRGDMAQHLGRLLLGRGGATLEVAYRLGEDQPHGLATLLARLQGTFVHAAAG